MQNKKARIGQLCKFVDQIAKGDIVRRIRAIGHCRLDCNGNRRISIRQ